MKEMNTNEGIIELCERNESVTVCKRERYRSGTSMLSLNTPPAYGQPSGPITSEVGAAKINRYICRLK